MRYTKEWKSPGLWLWKWKLERGQKMMDEKIIRSWIWTHITKTSTKVWQHVKEPLTALIFIVFYMRFLEIFS